MQASSTQRKQAIETHRTKLEEGQNTKTQGVTSLQEKLKALDAEIVALHPKTARLRKMS
jgi:TolA-binding protein